MQPHLLSPEAEGVILTVPERGSEAQTLLESFAGNSAVRVARRVIALGAITGSLFAAGSLTAEAASADAPGPTPAAALAASPHRPSATSSHTGPSEDVCTDIVPFPGGYYFGTACSNDKLIKLGESNSGRFSYGMLIVNGVYKCGYVKN